MIQYNNINSFSEVHLGSNKLSQVYFGDNLIYPIDTSYKFLITFTGGTSAKTACDASSAITQNEISINAQTVVIGDCVTSIGDRAFNTNSVLSSITIPNTVTSIGVRAFYNCSSLESITIPSGVTVINNNCFKGCQSLTAIDIPSGVTSIGYSAFYGCSSLTSVTIPSGVTSIGDSAFYGCSSLTAITCNAVTPPILGGDEIEFGDTNNCPIYVPCESVNAYKTAWSQYESRIQCVTPSFSGKWLATYSDSHTESAECDSTSAITGSEITKTDLVSVEVGDCVTSIGSYALNKCYNLSNLTIGSSVTTIGQQAFSVCWKLPSLVIPDSVTSIGDQCFAQCTGLTSVTIGSGLTDIYNAAFKHCSGLTSVAIPNTVTRISAFAFENCSGLTTVEIGSGITSIGQGAFQHCSSLTSVTVNAITPPILGNGSLIQFDDTNNCPIYVPSGSVNDYKASVGWQPYADRIQAIPNS